MNGRKRALTKITSWWKKNKITAKEKSQKEIHNYFDCLLKSQEPKLPLDN